MFLIGSGPRVAGGPDVRRRHLIYSLRVPEIYIFTSYSRSGRTMNFNGGISEEAGEIKSAATGTFFFPSRRPVAFCFRRESHYNLDFHGAPGPFTGPL